MKLPQSQTDNFNLHCLADQLFLINVNQRKHQTDITLQLFTIEIYTGKTPEVSVLLERFIPQIFEHHCFNEGNLSFAEEVKNTEIGHLFEHILLEYISELKHQRENNHGGLKGETYWDWNSEPRGTFHITLSLGLAESEVLLEALGKSLALLKMILRLQPGKANAAAVNTTYSNPGEDGLLRRF